MERRLLPKMTILAWLLSVFKALFPPQRVSLNSTPFETLPFELVISIAKYLSPSDAASFALSGRRIRAVLGNQHLDSLRPEASDEPSRLQMPLDIACDSCLMHHQLLSERHRDVLYARREEPLDEVDDDEIVAMCLSLSESFVDITFRSVMKLHCYGINCQKLLALFADVDTGHLPGVTNQWASACRISNGRLIFRHQNWILHPAGATSYSLPPSGARLIVCPHYNILHERFNDKLSCRLDHWRDAQRNMSCSVCSGLFQCTYCPTEFQIDVKDFGAVGVALVVTRWLDLGEGRSALDPSWDRHLLKIDRGIETPITFPAGSIKQDFQQRLPSEELLTPKCSALLFGYNPLLWEGREKPVTVCKRKTE
jgi:hypothetical protein